MTAARPDTWMPLYWGDYAKDTGHLGAAQHGAYLMLIKHYWVTGRPLPDDDAQLWRIACADSLGHWRKIKPVVMAFFRLEDGFWHHGRVDHELGRADAFVAQRSTAGRASAEARRRQREGNDRSTGAEHPLQREPQREAKTSQSQSQSPDVSNIGTVTHEARATTVDTLEPPPFLKRTIPGRAAPLPPDWVPSDVTQHAIEKARPDLSRERIVQRTAEFRAHCAETNKHSHNIDAYWFNFVVKTHAERTSTPRPVSSERSPAHDGIRAARARRSVLAGD